MKTKYPNRLLNHAGNILLPGQTPISMMKLLLFIVLFVSSVTRISAQELDEQEAVAPNVTEISAYLSALRSADATSRVTESRATQVEDLIKKVQPSVYFYSGIVKTYGARPKHLFTNLQSLDGVANASMLKNNIEIATIRIESSADLSESIDLSVFSSFSKLKYIYIISDVNVTQSQLTSMISNQEARFGVFYKLDQGDSAQ